MADPYVHTPDDGRGQREVRCNGVLLSRVMYADTRRGIVRFASYPVRVNRRGEIVTTTRRGKITVHSIHG